MIRFFLSRVIMVVILTLLGQTFAHAQEARILVGDLTVSSDISSQRQLVISTAPEASLLGLTEKAPVTLKAAGHGERHYWSLFSLKNTTDKALNFVLSFQPQGFTGAGLLVPSMTVEKVLGASNLRDGTPLRLIDGGAWQYIYVAVEAGDVTNIAVESNGPAISSTLWRASDFGSASAGPLFLTGFMQGIAILGLVALVGLYIFRPQRVTLAGVLFGCSLLLFIEGDLGLFALPLSRGWVSASLIRAFVETLMAATLTLCVVTFHGSLVSRRLAYAGVASGLVAASLANIAYAVVEPVDASAVARVIFVACVALGVLLGASRRNVRHRLGFDWLFWLALVLWTALAAFMAGWGTSIINGHLWLAAASLVLLFVTVLVLIRFVSDLRRSETPAMMRAEMRSLAMAAGQHVLWEWMPEHGGFLRVGPELPRRLNLDPEEWEGNARLLFHSVLHPFDFAAYQNVAERPDLKPGEAVAMELRLRSHDGSYHWYELQARSIRGAHNTAQRVIGTLTDIHGLKLAADEQAMDGIQDAITGLPTKALFMDRLERVLAHLGGLPFRIVVLDIDRFKALNEGLGQEVGDSILKTVAGRITSLLEPDESAARLTGGQFVLHCAESLTRGDFATFLHRLEEEVAAPIGFGSQEVVISASIGVSNQGGQGMDAQDLLDQALVATLEARKDGGARTTFYRANMTDDRAKLFSLESDLRRALARHEIEIYYQPIVDLLTLQVRGFEALARWRHPDLGLLAPADFMDIVETSGLMPELTQFMMQGAARQLGIWKRIHMRGEAFFVSVNVSASQLVDPQFGGRVQQVLSREQPEPGSLKIEITETVIMRQPERSAQVLRQLRAMGVGLACDDFGTGFSSLASLRDLPFDTLKIDRSFIAGGDFEERNAKIISSITALAEGLGMSVVAEGIETQLQIDALAALGCTLGQGYLLGMPDTAEAATARLSAQRFGVSVLQAPVAEEDLNTEEPVSAFATFNAVPPSDPEELPSIFPVKAEPEMAEEAEPVATEAAEAEAPQPEIETAAKASKPARKRKPAKKTPAKTAKAG